MRSILVFDEHVEEAWREVSQASDPARGALLLEEFAKRQPALSVFVGEALEGLSPDGADLGYFTALVIWRAFERAGGSALMQVEMAAVAEAYRSNESWLERVAQSDAILLEKKLRDFGSYAEPHAMRYAIESVFDAHEDGFELDPGDQERLLIMEKSMVDCLSRASSG